MNKKIIIFFGPPGSGKGTLAQHYVSSYGWEHVSTGNLLREHVSSHTEIGLEVSKIISQGNLVSDELIISMVQDELEKLASGNKTVIIDGFPRTKKQAEIFHYRLSKMNIPYDKVVIVIFDLDDETIFNRVGLRLVCSSKECLRVYSSKDNISKCLECGGVLERRHDDNINIIKKRLDAYRLTEGELIAFWKEHLYKKCFLKTNISFEDTQDQFNECIGFVGCNR